MPISCVLIVKNEAANIVRCLESLAWADEIVVLDTGSTDTTLQICRERGVKLHFLNTWEGFGKAKQAALDLATQDWVLSIDADEVVSAELQTAIKSIISDTNALAGYRVKRRTWFVTRWIDHCGWDKDFPLRLFQRKLAAFTPDLVHESVQVKGKVGTIMAPLLHYSYPSLEQHQTRLVFYARLWAEERYRRGRKCSVGSAILHALWKFVTMYLLQQGFRDGKAGLVLSINSSYSVYFKHLRLWELNQKDR